MVEFIPGEQTSHHSQMLNVLCVGNKEGCKALRIRLSGVCDCKWCVCVRLTNTSVFLNLPSGTAAKGSVCQFDGKEGSTHT